MSFEFDFRQWLAEGFRQPIPASVKAFSFNLFEYPETPTCKFGIEIIGTSRFDENDSDWASEEIWEPSARAIEIPKSYSGLDWEECLGKAKDLITICLNTIPEGDVLKSRLAVGVGFVDGGLEVIWRS